MSHTDQGPPERRNLARKFIRKASGAPFRSFKLHPVLSLFGKIASAAQLQGYMLCCECAGVQVGKLPAHKQ